MDKCLPNNAVEQTAGSHSLAAAAHRERWAAMGRERRSMKSAYLGILLAILVFSGCSEKQDRTAARERSRGPVPLSQLSDFENEVFPLANGNAYLVNTIERQLFLLSKDKAARVDGVDLQSFDALVYPLPDGAAYLVSSNGRRLRLYYLLADKAIPVQEGSIQQGAVNREPASAEAFLWAQTQAALSRYRRARAEADAASESDDR